MDDASELHMLKYKCEKCKFSTKEQRKYENHVSLHKDIKFACTHCKYVSYTKGHIQKHLVTHTGEFPYRCEYCGYGAIRNDYLIKHIRRIHGDGQIQCSVSINTNDSKNNSINITQNALQKNIQEISQTTHTLSSKSNTPVEVVDLTTNLQKDILLHKTVSESTKDVGSLLGCGSHVEVELIHPVEKQLHPGMPLTVVAPSTFQVPSNCIAELVEVRCINGTYHLILKFFEQVHSTFQDGEPKNVNTCEKQKQLENITKVPFKPERPEASTSPCLLQAVNTLSNDCNGKLLQTILTAGKDVTTTREFFDIDMTVPCNLQAPKDTQNFLGSLSQQSIGSISNVLEGPFISSVFSLSTESGNILEGICWASCPKSSTDTSLVDVKTLNPSPFSECPPKGEHGNNVPGAEYNSSEVGKDKDQQIQKTTLQNVINELSETKTNFGQTDEVKQESVDVDIKLPPGKRVRLCDRTLRSSSRQKKRGLYGHKSNSVVKVETTFCTKPQTLFLSCDKTVTMQPLTCATQNSHNDVPTLSERRELLDKSKSFGSVNILSKQESVSEHDGERICKVRQWKRKPHTQKQSQIKRPQKTYQEKSCSKDKIKRPYKRQTTSNLKKALLQSSRRLKLVPAKSDQLIQTPDFRQPVVVLNHPDVESLETFHVMKVINKFKGNVVKVTLSRRMCKLMRLK
ncbi:hypothetical protein FKM82_001613 [Ascaphus truei]|uniref:zinc finger protein 518B n=1 Tax=Ascaphus truei TaxID=8439 RepID=UPI003F595E97